MSKVELGPPRGRAQRVASELSTSCELVEQSCASQPAVKNFHMDKIQILEQADGLKAVPVFQRLRCLTMRLNPSNTEERKHTLTIDEKPNRPLKQCRTLSPMPTTERLKND